MLHKFWMQIKFNHVPVFLKFTRKMAKQSVVKTAKAKLTSLTLYRRQYRMALVRLFSSNKVTMHFAYAARR